MTEIISLLIRDSEFEEIYVETSPFPLKVNILNHSDTYKKSLLFLWKFYRFLLRFSDVFSDNSKLYTFRQNKWLPFYNAFLKLMSNCLVSANKSGVNECIGLLRCTSFLLV